MAAYVDRIAVSPGQLVSYGAGELAIRELRARAETELLGSLGRGDL